MKRHISAYGKKMSLVQMCNRYEVAIIAANTDKNNQSDLHHQKSFYVF